MIPRLLRIRQPQVAYLHDLLMAVASLAISLYLRLGDDITALPDGFLTYHLAIFGGLAALVFWPLGLYRGVWRYASLDDLLQITRAVTLLILLFVAVMFVLTRLDGLPRSVFFINWFVLLGLLGGPRFVYRLFKDGRVDLTLRRTGTRRVPVLLVGAGDEADLFIRAMTRSPDAAYRVVGVVDEKGTRVGRRIHKVSVMGTVDRIPDVVETLTRHGDRPQRLIITKNEIDGPMVRSLLDTADALGMTLARLPRLTEFRSDNAERITARPIAVEDLLGRPQAVLDRDAMRTLIAGRRVMVTGAGGTIGSELVHQLSDFAPAHLTLLDSTEFNLYSIDMELAQRHPDLSRAAVLADVRSSRRIDHVMAAERPDLVFHAAALKHVPMVEANPEEGALTNIGGTRNVADACRRFGVAAMVLISTDKAINPTSIMGATKRIAESYCQALDLLNGDGRGTRFVTVRFGNVLGSTGSVVPLFEKQLAGGGPLTVTHPDMKRYFMTVREAVELVLQASVMGTQDSHEGGKIYVLDMGEPIRISDLAEQMIRLAGLRPGEDIEIRYTGLRPGEKLFEELFHDSEAIQPSGRQGILIAAPRTTDRKLLARAIDELLHTAEDGRNTDTRDHIRRLVPENALGPAAYRPDETAADIALKAPDSGAGNR